MKCSMDQPLNANLKKPKITLKSAESAFSYSRPTLWSKLPADLRSVTTVFVFSLVITAFVLTGLWLIAMHCTCTVYCTQTVLSCTFLLHMLIICFWDWVAVWYCLMHIGYLLTSTHINSVPFVFLFTFMAHRVYMW